ncbi:MAG: M20/M25/M40 family metallo-hydrolase [Dictyoglomaceae bacterium]|nr:M20/M25/M40 family metallo-hydrolase [Dictyoglomaceae bacterium]
MLSNERLINIFFNLVKISSVSLKEKDFADFLKQELQRLGLEVIEDSAGEKVGGNAGNIYAYLDGEGEPFFVSAHMDTVTPGENINPKIEGEYIVSDGTTILGADDKSAISAMIEALTVLREEKAKTKKIEFIFTIGEEVGLIGAKNIDKSLIVSKEGYVFDGEGDVGTIILKAPSHERFYLKILGKAAHAGVAPEKGVNAILLTSEFIIKLPWGRIDDETTANIGRISGGRATNIVPDEVDLEGEFRGFNKEKLDSLWEDLKEKLSQVENKGGRYNLRREFLYEGFDIDKNEKVVQRMVSVLKNMNKDISFTYTMGGSDANVFNSYGLKTINVGVGMENAHSRSERVKVENLQSLSLLLYNLIKA